MTLQPPQRRVVDKGDATVRALAHLAAVAAEDEGCQAAAIQEENRLLPAFERSSHRGLELPAERAELSAGDLLSHVDHRDRWQRPALGAVWQLEQVRAARQGARVGRDARRGAAQDQNRLGSMGEPAGHRWGVISRDTLLLERR